MSVPADYRLMDVRSGPLAPAADPTATERGAGDDSHWSARPKRWARTAWTPAWLAKRPRALRIAIRSVAILMLTLFAIWLILFVTKGRFLKGPFERFATSQLERQVDIGGDFQLYFAPFNVKFYAEDIRIANPAWAREKQFFTAKTVDTRLSTFRLIFGDRILRFANLDGARVALEWDAGNKRNSWTFGDPDAPPEPLELPVIQRAAITDSGVTYRDPRLRLFADIDIDTVKASESRLDETIGFSGRGTMRAQPFTLTGSLASPNETLAGGKNKLTLHAVGLGNTLDVAGTLPGPTELEGADLKMQARGANLSRLFDFLGVAIPDTRRYRVTSALTYEDEIWKLSGIKGVFGDSDLAGSLAVSQPGGRVHLKADLVTRSLNIIDAGPFVGYEVDRLDKMGTGGAIKIVGGRPRVLPDSPLRADALKRFDADLRYKVARVRAESFPVSNVDLTLSLKRGLMEMKPLTFLLAGGKVASTISIDSRPAVVRTAYDIRLSPTRLGTLLARFGVEESGTTGTVSGRIQMVGHGDSLRQSLASSNGRIAFVLPQGSFWTRNIQLAELDVGTFVQKLFEDKLKKPVQINCGVIAFTVRNGVGAADPILIDTEKNVVLGRGGFSFRSEAIDMAVRADGKKFSLFSGQSPVAVGGYFAAPRIDPISDQLLGRAGAGLGLAIVATPVALIIPFVDPGDAKSAQCGPVLAGATAAAQRTTKGKPRDDVGKGTTAKSEDGKQSADGKKEQRKKFLGIF
ncbi:AsmA family protein [Sphingopyxis sp. QXT-31]|uniref:AsmA family protein n=1 Tax=Sphingopyxis sp. QXT-31 TaxID=1357916 RepID=UPI001E4B93D9|nr:AsmA family protein [Sphingopyxis sp. QXT-31]